MSSEGDKNNMPDGSGPLAEALHAETILQSINGDQESPLGVPESPEDKGIIRCICGIEEDDGFTIFCERCSVWQHGACVGIQTAKEAPEKYLCDRCNPRPLDVQKAIRHQRQRQELENSANAKPKRRSTSDKKAKPNHQGATLGPTPSLPAPQNRKEKHPSPPRRTEAKRPRAAARAQTAPQVETITHEDVDVVNDEEADLPFWSGAEDYGHRQGNEFSPEMGQFLEQRLQQLDNLSLEDLPPEFERLDSIRDYTRKTYRAQPSTKLPVFSSLARTYAIFAAEPMNEQDLIMEYTGKIGLQNDYKSDPINQYSTLQRPKQYVLFSPPNTLDIAIYIDARLYGNDARYVRRSCFPNARVSLICVSNPSERGIHFGIFALKPIKSREEITIGHDWNFSHRMEQMIAGVTDETRQLLEVYPSEIIRSMATYANDILANGDCACIDEHCTFTRIRKAAASLPEESSRRSSGGDVDAMSIDGIQQSDEPEPSDMEDDSRPNSRGTQKPSSRDRTPSRDGITTSSRAPNTDREQRKIDQAMARFAQMEEKNKRKKSADSMEIDDTGATKRRRQGSVTGDSTRPVALRVPSNKGRGVKRKSMSPSPGADRRSESGVSTNASPKPGGRVPNRVKRSKEPSNKKVRLEAPPPPPLVGGLPNWIKKATLSESWTPPQMMWYKKYAENAKREYELQTLKEELKEEEEMQVTEKQEPVVPTQSSTTPSIENTSTTKTPPNLRVAMPSASVFTTGAEPTHGLPSATATNSSTSSYFPNSNPPSATLPAPSPVAPSTPKVKITLADYRARRASGMVTPSTPSATDPLTQTATDGFIPPSLPGSRSPEQTEQAPPAP